MDQRVELRHLRYFLVLAEELHFGQAAFRLGIAQPALSQQVKQLEKYIGVPLFDRTSRSVRLTDAGAALEPRARDLLARLSSDLEEARRVGRGEAGRLEVAFINSATTIVSDRLRAFSRSFPDVQVKLRNGFTVNVLDALERGTADVGIVRDPESRTGIDLRLLEVERFVAVLPSTHASATAATVRVDEFATEPLILYPRTAGTRAFEVNTQPFRDAGVDVVVAQECSDWPTIIALVAAGLGVTLAPYSVTGQLPPGAVRCELDGGGQHVSQIFLASRTGDTRPLVRSFITATGRDEDRGSGQNAAPADRSPEYASRR
ncbi:LysR substrate-binding domain-containing protein [Prescottella agglutinans]|uniref:DNA-binding transcriptional LysR family regulator n=1 Tax=Prescottella agglutinans TaxID=1644129 RepID=A0ABT6M5W7_9NOCA|nr:LysR substrate-binding domain-containing protein [Prescottella agglutinans]MDH6279716.1 DNA-binding transcriptional LysR family regulator [Prescottella agglutinans]